MNEQLYSFIKREYSKCTDNTGKFPRNHIHINSIIETTWSGLTKYIKKFLSDRKIYIKSWRFTVKAGKP